MARGTDDALDAGALGRWGAFSAVVALLGLVMAANAADDYMYVCGALFVAFGLFLGTRLLSRWQP